MRSLLMPEASTSAPELDYLFMALLAMTAAVLLLVFGLLFTYMIRYRASSPEHRGTIAQKTWRFEVAWTVATMVVFFGLFIWGADLYVRLTEAPAGALRIYVVGKQWMWKVEHPGGQREIDALHIPAGRDVQLLMTSEDVIHDFAVPDFRIKHDVLPGRYESLWFRANEVGTHRIFCTQFCGTDHSKMTGEVVVMRPADYAQWLETNGGGPTLAEAGKALFIKYGCAGCHIGDSSVRAPRLNGVYGGPVPLADGSIVTADDAYIRDSILQPTKQVVAGFAPLMPSFAGVIPEGDLLRLIAYIKSMGIKSLGTESNG